jgi:hypothetical protein
MNKNIQENKNILFGRLKGSRIKKEGSGRVLAINPKKRENFWKAVSISRRVHSIVGFNLAPFLPKLPKYLLSYGQSTDVLASFPSFLLLHPEPPTPI